MGWDMKDNEVRYTEDRLVQFVASVNVPETNIIEPYSCQWRDTDSSDSGAVYAPYLGIIQTPRKKYKENLTDYPEVMGAIDGSMYHHDLAVNGLEDLESIPKEEWTQEDYDSYKLFEDSLKHANETLAMMKKAGLYIGELL